MCEECGVERTRGVQKGEQVRREDECRTSLCAASLVLLAVASLLLLSVCFLVPSSDPQSLCPLVIIVMQSFHATSGPSTSVCLNNNTALILPLEQFTFSQGAKKNFIQKILLTFCEVHQNGFKFTSSVPTGGELDLTFCCLCDKTLLFFMTATVYVFTLCLCPPSWTIQCQDKV